jgi:hypothetical protein
MYVYIQSEKSSYYKSAGKEKYFPGLWTVGFYDPDGKFHPESDHDSADEAAERVSFLNGNAK